MILADNETKVDLLNNEAIAFTIVRLLRQRPENPVTIGVHGDWGAGKSSILEMISAILDQDKAVLCLKFNGWRFQGFEDAKIALIEGIVTGLVEARPLLSKAGAAVKDLFRRIDWLKVAKKAGGLAFTAFTGIPTFDQIQTAMGMLEGLFTDPSMLVTKEEMVAALKEAKGLLVPTAESKNVPQEITAFRKAFDELLQLAEVEQLVVLIDDLDRCLPDTAIETLEAVRLFVFTSRTAFVVAADEAMIEYAVRKHFPNLPDTTGPLTYARNYLEKLIQVPFRIPPLGETETRIYVTLLLVEAVLGENDPDFMALVTASREKLKRPWASGPLDAKAVKQTLGAKATRVQDALTLSDQIGPILASGTRGNPRQIKRFLNTLVLRQHIAEARGFGNDVKLPVLAKLMLVERFLPGVFDQIASVAAIAPDGVCSDLAALETAVRGPQPTLEVTEKAPEADKAASAEVVKVVGSTLLNEWLTSPVVCTWSQVEPPIGGLDLRPYLFVTKDRKDYFGGASTLGHLATVAERLLGGRFAVQVLESDLRQLAGPEAAQLFELVRSRIVASDNFEVEPSGAAGLEVLVRAHPNLQGHLLDFLEALPRNRLGPWACKGWERIIKDPDMIQRFDRLLQIWSESGGALLKAAAKATLTTRKGRN
ncbi:MAG: Qat anti-phage system ATPase QatA [Desulfobaccales bacterium]